MWSYLQHRPASELPARNGPSPAKAAAPPRTTLHSQTLQQQPLPSRGVQQCHVRIVSNARVTWISKTSLQERLVQISRLRRLPGPHCILHPSPSHTYTMKQSIRCIHAPWQGPSWESSSSWYQPSCLSLLLNFSYLWETKKWNLHCICTSPRGGAIA